MFKPIKFIFKLVGLLVLIFTLLPIIALVIMYKDYTPPIEDFEAHSSLSFNDILTNKMDAFLEDDSSEAVNLTFTKSEANAAIKDLYAAENPNFGSSDTSLPESERKYAMAFGTNGGFKGATLNFYDDSMTVEAGIEAGIGGFYYKTTVFLDLGLFIEQVTVNGVVQNEYKLQIKNISFGNLPILWMYDVSNWFFKLVTQKDLSTVIQDSVSDFGSYDLETKSIWINSTDIIDMLTSEDPSAKPALEALFGLIDEGELLASGFSETEGGILLNLGRARSTKADYVLTSHITNDTEVNTMFQNQLSSILLSSLGGTGNLNYDMNEQSFNKLIEYYVGDAMNQSMDFELGDEVYKFETKPLFAEFVNGKVVFTIIMNLYKDSNPTKAFKTHFSLTTTPQVAANREDLEFIISKIDIGDNLELTNDKVASILALIGENDLIDGNKIVVKEMLGNFVGQGVTVESVLVKGKYLRFVLKPDSSFASVLADLEASINDALEDTLMNPTYSDVNDAYQNYLNDPENNDISDIMDAVNDLSPADQEAFYLSLNGSLSGVTGLEDLLP